MKGIVQSNGTEVRSVYRTICNFRKSPSLRVLVVEVDWIPKKDQSKVVSKLSLVSHCSSSSKIGMAHLPITFVMPIRWNSTPRRFPVACPMIMVCPPKPVKNVPGHGTFVHPLTSLSHSNGVLSVGSDRLFPWMTIFLIKLIIEEVRGSHIQLI